MLTVLLLYHNRSYLSSRLATKPSFLAGLRYVLTKRLLLRLILVYSLTSFLNAGLMLSIMLLAQAKEGYDMSPKDVSRVNTHTDRLTTGIYLFADFPLPHSP